MKDNDLRTSVTGTPLRKKIIFAMVMVAGLLLFLETSLRLFWTRPRRIIRTSGQVMMPDTTLGWRPTPNLQTLGRYGAATQTVTVKTNSRGFRDREHSLEADSGVARILVLGDSFAFGVGVSNGEIFTDHLQSMLPRTEVINLGVTGYRTIQYRRILQEEGLSFEPRLVLLAFCQNDVAEQKLPRTESHGESQTGTNWRDWLNEKSYLCDFVGDRVSRNKRLSKALIAAGVKRPLGGFAQLSDLLRTSLIDYPPELVVMWNETLDEILEINRMCDEAAAQLLVAAIPSREAVDDDALQATLTAVEYEPKDFDVAKPYRKLGEFCRQNQIAYVEAYHAASQSNVPLYLPNDMHFNSAGHRLFAEVLAVKIRELLAADRPAPMNTNSVQSEPVRPAS